MVEVYGDLFDVKSDFKLICINGTTSNSRDRTKRLENSFTSLTAKRALIYYRQIVINKNLPYNLKKLVGQRIRTSGNKLHVFNNLNLITLPTKHRSKDRYADPQLIAKGLNQLMTHKNFNIKTQTVAIPYVGCGTGQINRDEMKEVLEHLPNSVILVNYNTYKKRQNPKPNVIVHIQTGVGWNEFLEAIPNNFKKGIGKLLIKQNCDYDYASIDMLNQYDYLLIPINSNFKFPIGQIMQNIEAVCQADVLVINWNGKDNISQHLIKTARKQGLAIMEFIDGEEK